MQEGSLSPHPLQHLLSVDFFYDDHSEQLAIDLKRISETHFLSCPSIYFIFRLL